MYDFSQYHIDPETIKIYKEVFQNLVIVDAHVHIGEDIDKHRLILKKLIKNEQEKLEMPSLIDLDYDIKLRHAVDIFKSNNIVLKAKAS